MIVATKQALDNKRGDQTRIMTKNGRNGTENTLEPPGQTCLIQRPTPATIKGTDAGGTRGSGGAILLEARRTMGKEIKHRTRGVRERKIERWKRKRMTVEKQLVSA